MATKCRVISKRPSSAQKHKVAAEERTAKATRKLDKASKEHQQHQEHVLPPDTSRDAEIAARLQLEEERDHMPATALCDADIAAELQLEEERAAQVVRTGVTQHHMPATATPPLPWELQLRTSRGIAGRNECGPSVFSQARGALASPQALAVPSGHHGVMAVQTQKQKHRVTKNVGGAEEEACIGVKQQKILKKNGGAPVEKRTECRDERVQRLTNGRTIVTETVTIQKISYLD